MSFGLFSGVGLIGKDQAPETPSTLQANGGRWQGALMTSGESPILARSPATGLSGVVKPAGEAAFNLPQHKRTILAHARTSGRKERAADIARSNTRGRLIRPSPPSRPEVLACARMTDLYIGNKQLEHSPTRLKHLVAERMLQIHLLEQPLFDQVDST